MKNILTRIRLPILVISCLTAATALAEGIDGKWTGEMKVAGGKKSQAEARAVPVTLTLKSEGSTLTGSISAGKGKKGNTADIINGQVQGDRISFQTVMKTKKGDQTIRWQGTLAGEELKMTRQGKGKRANSEFSLKRAG
jgi:hypothetical protein